MERIALKHTDGTYFVPRDTIYINFYNQVSGKCIDKLAEYEDEAEQREKGCNYCFDTFYVKRIRNTMPLLAPTTRVDELRYELLNLTGEQYCEIEPNFCPVCGRKLR